MRTNLKALMDMPALPMYAKGKYLSAIDSPIYQWMITRPEIAEMMLSMANDSGMLTKDSEGLFVPKFTTMEEFEAHKEQQSKAERKERSNQKRTEVVQAMHDRINKMWGEFPESGIPLAPFAREIDCNIPTAKRWVGWSNEYKIMKVGMVRARVFKVDSSAMTHKTERQQEMDKVLELAFQAVSWNNGGKVLEFDLAKEFAIKWTSQRMGLSIQESEDKVSGYSRATILDMCRLKDQTRFVASGEGSRFVDSEAVDHSKGVTKCDESSLEDF